MKNRSKRKRRFIRVYLVLGILLASGLGFFLFESWKVAYERAFPNIGALKSHYPVVSYRGKSRPSVVFIQKSRPRNWVSLSAISRVAVGAVVVSEDWAFYQHSGIDPEQMKEAFVTDLKELSFARGASTITQQVGKNVFLFRDKTLLRKALEIMLAIRMERVLSKNRILEIYLNIAEWGEGIFGIGAASRFYFNKTPDALTAKEGAFLAMLLPSPKRYSESFRNQELSRFAKRTIRSILQKMVQAGYLTDTERTMASEDRLIFEN